MPEYANEYHVRTYRDGDEVHFTRLFNNVYEAFSGFVPRTPDYWRWCCKMRPDVSSEGIVVVENKKKIVGYAVIGKSGNMWEFCYDPAYDGRTIISRLLTWSIKYVESNGGDSIILNAPANDYLLREVCGGLDFAEQPPFFPLFVSVLDFPQLIKEILSRKNKILERNNETLLIRLKHVPPWIDSCVTIQSRGGEISVEGGKVDVPKVTIETDISTLASCIFGTAKIFRAILSLRLKIRPIWKLPTVLKLFSALNLRGPWYVPGGDFG